ncbi:MAG: DUF1385 domain-containing protein [Candidatus Bipolaricaulota bacterium]|nr:MAG: DUF1385 domain-containing protein [Candidatus Bipolaricaulota bacterium]
MPPIGGQAVIEGVMMQNGDRVAVAVRREGEGDIVVRDLPVRRRFRRIGKIPFVRGLFRLVDMVSLGVRALNLSATLAFPEEAQIGKGGMAVTFVAAFAIAVGGFVILPLFIVNSVTGLRTGNAIVFNLVEGLVRVTFFLGYLFIISRLKDIRRVFQYHGAEHKTVAAYEAGEPLTVDSAKRHTTRHARCGTSFLMIVLMISILVFSLAGNPVLWLKILSRLLLLPVVAGVSYEILRLGGDPSRRSWFHWLSLPGIWMQRLTTAEPTDDMIEVALTSIRRVTEPAAAAATESPGAVRT